MSTKAAPASRKPRAAGRYETRRDRLATRHVFARRLGVNVAVALCLIAVSLAAGMAGYHFLGGLTWIDAFLNAAMILSGMGPVEPLKQDCAKIFAGFYAIFSGLLIFGVAGLILAPVYHRLLHKFHVGDET